MIIVMIIVVRVTIRPPARSRPEGAPPLAKAGHFGGEPPRPQQPEACGEPLALTVTGVVTILLQ